MRLIPFLLLVIMGCSSTMASVTPNDPAIPVLPPFSVQSTEPTDPGPTPSLVEPKRDADDKPLVATVYFEGDIGPEAVRIFAQLVDEVQAKDVDYLIIDISSPGGDVEAGYTISKMIEMSPANIVCVVDGEADSMAFFILQSCDQRYMTKRSVLMIHNPAFQVHPNEPEYPDYYNNKADFANASADALLEHESSKLKISKTELASHIQGSRQWWLNWKKADEIGAVDGTVKSVQDVAKDLRAGKDVHFE